MPAYNFKPQFARAVELGVKCQTIRRRRKNPTRVGDTLYLSTGMRTGNCRFLRQSTCTAVVPVTITPNSIVVNGHALSNMNEQRAFAQKDGFDRLDKFYDFFIENYGLSDDNPSIEMELITWSTATEPITAPDLLQLRSQAPYASASG